MARSTERHIYFGLLFRASLAGLYCAYWLLFYHWRSAADPADDSLWQPRILGWFLACVLSQALWAGVVIAFVRTFSGSTANKSPEINH